METKEIVRLCNSNLTRLSRLHYIWDTEKPSSIIIMLYPEHQLLREDSTLLSKLRLILEHNGYGSFTMLFQYPIIIKPECEFLPKKISKEALLKNIALVENTFKTREGNVDVICAWGSIDNDSCMWLPFLYLADKYRLNVKCFGTTSENSPKRPHYLPLATQILPYEAIR